MHLFIRKFSKCYYYNKIFIEQAFGPVLGKVDLVFSLMGLFIYNIEINVKWDFKNTVMDLCGYN